MSQASTEFQGQLQTVANAVESALTELLRTRDDETPERLMAAMRHGLLGGGKRLRPFLLIKSAALFGVEQHAAMPAAAALECVHSYSLIHDDLPAMDDDDMRRGQPTVHKAFDEATAILAGDSLLTLAFEILANEIANPTISAELTLEMARAAGAAGMAGGQMLDLEAEASAPDETGIRRLQLMKTGALISYACRAGAILGEAENKQREALSTYGAAIGAAFQIKDDLLDIESSADELGKAVQKDSTAGKATLVSTLGQDKSTRELDELISNAKSALSRFGDEGEPLRQLADFMKSRRN